jgi:hypothetical protein
MSSSSLNIWNATWNPHKEDPRGCTEGGELTSSPVREGWAGRGREVEERVEGERGTMEGGNKKEEERMTCGLYWGSWDGLRDIEDDRSRKNDTDPENLDD